MLFRSTNYIYMSVTFPNCVFLGVHQLGVQLLYTIANLKVTKAS